jgi:hypothetical protein
MINRSLDLFSILEPAYVFRPDKGDNFGALFQQLLAASRRPGIGNQLQAEGLATFLLSRFSNLFTQVMGMPPILYLIRLRVEKAQELLWFTEQPVK